MLDTVRRDRLSCYGHERDTTPALARLAQDAVLFEDAVSAAPWTLPSHASLFTGLPPSRHHAHHEHPGLDASRTTLAERLAGLGYETVGVCNNPWISERTGMTQGFERFVEPWRSRVAQDTFALNVFPDEEKHGLVDAGAEESLAELEAWFGERGSDRPFFLFVNLIEAHSYYVAPEPFRHRFTSSRLSMEEIRSVHAGFLRQAHEGRLAARTARVIQDLYDGELAYLDAWLERFLGLLRERGVLDESLLVVTSDHGEAFGEHSLCGVDLVDHQLSLHEELLAVPLVVRFPAAHPASRLHGLRAAAPVSTLDLVPTVLEVVGAAPDPALDGRSLADPAPPDGRALVSEYQRPLVHLEVLGALVGDGERRSCLADRRLVAIRVGRRKLLLDSRGMELWYDLAIDPREDRPEAPPDGADAMRALAAASLERMGAGLDVPPPDELGEAQREALRSLGYL